MPNKRRLVHVSLTQVLLVHVLAALGTTLAACNDEKLANETNFAAAINAYFADKPHCLSAVTYPANVPVGGFHSEPKFYEAFVEAGLLKREELKPPPKKFGDPDGMIRYTLTDKGRAALSDRGWCYGARKVVKIVNFTEPTDAFGRRISEVRYMYSYPDAPDWTRNKAVLAAIPRFDELNEIAGKAAEDRIVLVLTNRGWEVGG